MRVISRHLHSQATSNDRDFRKKPCIMSRVPAVMIRSGSENLISTSFPEITIFGEMARY